MFPFKVQRFATASLLSFFFFFFFFSFGNPGVADAQQSSTCVSQCQNVIPNVSDTRNMQGTPSQIIYTFQSAVSAQLWSNTSPTQRSNDTALL